MVLLIFYSWQNALPFCTLQNIQLISNKIISNAVELLLNHSPSTDTVMPPLCVKLILLIIMIYDTLNESKVSICYTHVPCTILSLTHVLWIMSTAHSLRNVWQDPLIQVVPHFDVWFWLRKVVQSANIMWERKKPSPATLYSTKNTPTCQAKLACSIQTSANIPTPLSPSVKHRTR